MKSQSSGNTGWHRYESQHSPCELTYESLQSYYVTDLFGKKGKALFKPSGKALFKPYPELKTSSAVQII